jgi:PIN domain nuclease of toxin-antitoxin system
MKLLLDTHIALWALADDRRLAAEAREAIATPENTVNVSAASIWEIAIKHVLGRSGIPFSAEAAIDYFKHAGYRLLPISPAHAAAVETLPALHGDPFDRLLVAQAMTEPIRLITHDKKVAAYSDAIMYI